MERDIQRLCLDYLAARGIFTIRVNSGLASMGGRRFQMSTPGMSDALALPPGKPALFLEFKAGTKQSEAQKSFQFKVEEAGHRYAIVRNLEDLILALA